MKINDKKMKIALARKSMSVSDLACICGISPNTINSWIKNKGKRNPTTRTLGIVAKALEVDVTELIED